jgi:hypothetical protein
MVPATSEARGLRAGMTKLLTESYGQSKDTSPNAITTYSLPVKVKEWRYEL